MNDNEEHIDFSPSLFALSLAINIVMWAAIIAIVRTIFFGG